MAELNSIVKLEELEYNFPKSIDFSKNILVHPNLLDHEKKYTHSVLPTASRIFYFLN